MKTVEVTEKVKPKRVRRSYPRREVYHRWIHSPEYCYTNKGSRYPVCGFEDWLFSGNIGERFAANATKDDILTTWSGWRKTTCIATINREKKYILINHQYGKQVGELMSAIPDDYIIFETELYIPSGDILNKDDLSDALKAHVEYLITRFIQTECVDFYCVLSGINRCCNKKYEDVFYTTKYNDKRFDYYNRILGLVKKYKLKKYDWYKEKPNTDVCITNYKGWHRQYLNVPMPSLKQIVTKRLFKPNDIHTINLRAFYTKYCYGLGISYKQVVSNYNHPIDKEGFEKLSSSINHPMLWDDLDSKPTTWNGAVKIIHKSIMNYVIRTNEENIKKSNDNYFKALDEINDSLGKDNIVNAWREGNYNNGTVILYNKYIPSNNHRTLGHWKVESIRPKDTNFINTQLRLSKNIVYTSKCATVSLDDAIKMWKLFKVTSAKQNVTPGIPMLIRLDDMNYKVGIYNLRAIEYNQKKTDTGVLLDKWEWCVIIGCHHIWIDDFMNFIKYYNLYAIFDIPAPEEEHKKIEVKNNNKPFKIKLKK